MAQLGDTVVKGDLTVLGNILVNSDSGDTEVVITAQSTSKTCNLPTDIT